MLTGGPKLGIRYQDDGQSILSLNENQQAMKRSIDEKVAGGRYRFETIDCCICRGRDFEPLTEKDRYGLKMPVKICLSCGLIQTNPRMDQASYSEFYNSEYRSLYVGEPRPSLPFFYDQYSRGRAVVRYVRDLLPRDGLVFEVGCGAGGILFAFREEGYAVQGIDLGAEYLEYGRENFALDLREASLHETDFSCKPALIIYSHVLEHILDLPRELKRLKEILGENGLLYIEVPGIKNIPQAYAGDLLEYLQNAHTYHFTLRTLTRLVESQGFELIRGEEFIRAVFKVSTKKSEFFLSDYEESRAFIENLEAGRRIRESSHITWEGAKSRRILLAPSWDGPGVDWEGALKALLNGVRLFPDTTVAMTLPRELIEDPPPALVAIAEDTEADMMALAEPEESQEWVALLLGTTLLVEDFCNERLLEMARGLGVRTVRILEAI